MVPTEMDFVEMARKRNLPEEFGRLFYRVWYPELAPHMDAQFGGSAKWEDWELALLMKAAATVDEAASIVEDSRKGAATPPPKKGFLSKIFGR